MPVALVHPRWSRSAVGFTVAFPEQVPLQLSHGFLWIGALVVGVTGTSIVTGIDPTQALAQDLWRAAWFSTLAFIVVPGALVLGWQWGVEPRLRQSFAVWEIDLGATHLVVRRDAEEVLRVATSEILAARYEPGNLVVETAATVVYVPLDEGLPYAGKIGRAHV